MIVQCLSVLLTCALLLPPAAAGMTDEVIDLPTCTLRVRTLQNPVHAPGPHILMMSGVPLSGAVFKHLAERLATRLEATSTMIDFPGVAGSSLKGEHHGIHALQTCLRDYLATQPVNLFILGDLALPVVAPLLPVTPTIRGLVVLNSVIKPSQVQPPFPMNFMRCCPHLARVLGSITPRAFYERQIRQVGLGRQDRVDPDELHALYSEIRPNEGLRRMSTLMNEIELDEAGDQAILTGLATPIPQLYLWGAADPALGSEYKHLPELATHQKLIVFPDARHFLMLDYPDELANAIVDWYDGLR